MEFASWIRPVSIIKIKLKLDYFAGEGKAEEGGQQTKESRERGGGEEEKGVVRCRCFVKTKREGNLPFGFLAFRKSKEFVLSLPDARQSMVFVK